MSARRYLVVVQDPRGYPGHRERELEPAPPELEPAPPEGPKQPVIHTAVLADDFEAMEARALAAEKRLADLRFFENDARYRLAEFVATVALCEWENGEWPDDDDLSAMRPGGHYIARAVIGVLDNGTARGFEESGF